MQGGAPGVRSMSLASDFDRYCSNEIKAGALLIFSQEFSTISWINFPRRPPEASVNRIFLAASIIKEGIITGLIFFPRENPSSLMIS